MLLITLSVIFFCFVCANSENIGTLIKSQRYETSVDDRMGLFGAHDELLDL